MKLHDTLDLMPVVYHEDPEKSTAKTSQESQEEKDCDRARDILLDVVEVGQQALKDLSDIAYQSQDPKSYTALKGVMDTMMEASNKIMDLQIKKEKILKKSDQAPSKVVNNNTLILTSEELNKMLDEMRGEKSDQV